MIWSDINISTSHNAVYILQYPDNTWHQLVAPDSPLNLLAHPTSPNDTPTCQISRSQHLNIPAHHIIISQYRLVDCGRVSEECQSNVDMLTLFTLPSGSSVRGYDEEKRPLQHLNTSCDIYVCPVLSFTIAYPRGDLLLLLLSFISHQFHGHSLAGGHRKAREVYMCVRKTKPKQTPARLTSSPATYSTNT